MFTGLIETVGRLSESRARANYRALQIAAPDISDKVQLGESIACDGACLTVVETTKGSFVVEASQETLNKTIVGAYRPGRLINLERALKVGDRLGGHFVTGHIDTKGDVDYIRSLGASLELAVTYSTEFDALVVEKGSIAINGISLTVNHVRRGWCAVNLIPHTASATNVSALKAGEKLNLEFDMIGKYVARLKDLNPASKITINKLAESGW